MLIALFIFTVVSIFEVRHLIKTREKKEAVLYLCLAVAAVALGAYVTMTPTFYSFAHIINALFKAQ